MGVGSSRCNLLLLVVVIPSLPSPPPLPFSSKPADALPLTPPLPLPLPLPSGPPPTMSWPCCLSSSSLLTLLHACMRRVKGCYYSERLYDSSQILVQTRVKYEYGSVKRCLSITWRRYRPMATAPWASRKERNKHPKVAPTRNSGTSTY